MPETDRHIVALLVVALVLAAGALLAAVRAWRWAPLAGYASLIAAYLGNYCPVGNDKLWFWAVASVLAFGINMLLPKPVSTSRIGVPYFFGGAVAGGVVGMLSNTEAGIIIGGIIGLLLAAVAFSRLDAGRVLEFPSKKFFNYLCAKGLPLIVTISTLCILGIFLISLRLQ